MSGPSISVSPAAKSSKVISAFIASSGTRKGRRLHLAVDDPPDAARRDQMAGQHLEPVAAAEGGREEGKAHDVVPNGCATAAAWRCARPQGSYGAPARGCRYPASKISWRSPTGHPPRMTCCRHSAYDGVWGRRCCRVPPQKATEKVIMRLFVVIGPVVFRTVVCGDVPGKMCAVCITPPKQANCRSGDARITAGRAVAERTGTAGKRHRCGPGHAGTAWGVVASLSPYTCRARGVGQERPLETAGKGLAKTQEFWVKFWGRARQHRLPRPVDGPAMAATRRVLRYDAETRRLIFDAGTGPACPWTTS